MQAAFQSWADDAEPVRSSGAPLRRLGPQTAPDRRTAGRRGPAILAAVVGLLVGVSIGAAVYAPHRPGLPASRPPARPVRTLSVQTAQATPPPSGAAASTPIAPPAERPSLEAADAPPAAVAPPSPSYPVPAFDPARTAPPQRLAGGAAGWARPAAGYGEAPYAVAQPQPRAAPPVRPDALCGAAGIDRRSCLNQASFQADQDLRRSYQDAVDAGVPDAALREYTLTWRSLRQLGASQPGRMVLGYRRLTTALRADAERAAREDDAPGDDGSRDGGSRGAWREPPPNPWF